MTKEQKEIKYPATCTVHWPSGPVDACDFHRRALFSIHALLGGHLVATKLDRNVECINCVNEEGENYGK